MYAIEQWLKANAEQRHNKDGIFYIIKGGNCDETRFDIGDEYISVYWSNEYNEESFCHLTIDDFIREYMI